MILASNFTPAGARAHYKGRQDHQPRFLPSFLFPARLYAVALSSWAAISTYRALTATGHKTFDSFPLSC